MPGFHTFRHTFATRLFAEGRNAVQVQRDELVHVKARWDEVGPRHALSL